MIFVHSRAKCAANFRQLAKDSEKDNLPKICTNFFMRSRDASIVGVCDRLPAPLTVAERSSGNRAFTMSDEKRTPSSVQEAEDRSCNFPSPARS
jgi:hypothetical protein